MGHGAQTLLGNEFACQAVNTVGLVLNTGQCGLQALNELLLTLRHLNQLLFRLHSTTLLQCLVGV